MPRERKLKWEEVVYARELARQRQAITSIPTRSSVARQLGISVTALRLIEKGLLYRDPPPPASE